MPVVRRWFDEPKALPWEKMEESFFDETGGATFYTYPLYWLLPYVHLTEEDLAESVEPLWVIEIHPDSSLGVVNEACEGSFIIDLPANFGTYFDGLESTHRKKYRAVLRKNEDLEVGPGSQGDIDLLWPHYIERLHTLTEREGAGRYTQPELQIRREFYRSEKIDILRFAFQGELLGVNISYWESGIVYDLACLIRPTPEALRRSLGALAILKNIELSIEKGMSKYDLLSREYGYKRSYGAREMKLKHYVRGDAAFRNHYQIKI